MRELKKPTTFERQIEILKGRKLYIKDEERAKQILAGVNYYNIMGYGYKFRMKDDNYSEEITFEKLYNIYLFDKRIKAVILYAIEIVEHNIKTKLAYAAAHSLGALGYLDFKNFKSKREHSILIKKFQSTVKHNSKLDFVKHHIDKYDSRFPIWVAVELFTFGMLLNCYRYINTSVKKDVAKMFNTGVTQLESWIECVSYLRNMSAHYMRLFRINTQKTPKKCNVNCPDFKPSNKIYDILYIMKFMVSDKEEWNRYVINSLADAWNEYKDYVEYTDYGFSENWLEELTIK